MLTASGFGTARHPPDVLRRKQRVGEEDVGAGLRVAAQPVDDLVDAVGRRRVGARADHEVRIAAGVDRRLDLLHHLLGRDHGLSGHVPAALGRDLVLDGDGDDAGRLEGAHDEVHVEGVAVAGVGIGQERDGGALGEGAADPEIVVEGEDAAVGPAQKILGDAGARDGGRAIAALLHEPSAEAIENSRQNQDSWGFDQLTETSCLLRHGSPG
jgi:hypothetical protein